MKGAGLSLASRCVGFLFCGMLALACSKDDVTVEAEESPAKGGCEKDTDCKGDRICVRSKCRTPAKESPTADSKPALMPSATAAADERPPAPTAAAPAAPVAVSTYVPVASYSPRRGAEHAKVTIFEFTDFQCPHCVRLHPTLKSVQETYGDDVALHLRHFPLPSHTGSEPAARATQAAQRQGKAWGMIDLVFDNSKALAESDLVGYAAKLGLNGATFKTDLVSEAVKREVTDDIAAGRTAEVRGTPTVLINCKKFIGQRTLAGFKAVIDPEVERANALLAAGTPKDKLYETLCRTAP